MLNGCFMLSLLRVDDSERRLMRIILKGGNILRKTQLNVLASTILTLLMGMVFLPQIAKADWRNDIGIFRVGIITTDQSIDGLDKLAPFKLALSEALDMSVEFYRARNTLALIDAISSERIEYAIISTSGYALAWTTCQCIEPIVIPRSTDSTDGYHTILVSRPDGPRNLSELANKKIGVLTKNSITGNALAKHELSKQGILIGDEKAPFVEKPSGYEALKAFADGEVSSLIGWSSMTGNPSEGYSRGSLKQLAELHGMNPNTLSVLWKSKQIPHRPHIIRKRIHGEAKQILRNTLLSMNKKDPIAYDSIEREYGGGFSVGRHDRFLQVIELLEAQNAEKQKAGDIPPLQ